MTTSHRDHGHIDTQRARTTCRFVQGLLSIMDRENVVPITEVTDDGWKHYKIDSFLNWFSLNVSADGELAFCARGYHGADTDLLYIKCSKTDAAYYLRSAIDSARR